MNEETARLHDFDAEYGIIGWIISDSKVMSVLGGLKSDHFYSESHADIYQAVEALQRQNKDISIFTIQPLLKKPDLYDLTGGFFKYISGAFSHSLLYPKPKETAKHLVELSKKRELLHACQSLTVDGDINKIASNLINIAQDATKGFERYTIIDANEVSQQIVDDLKHEIKPIDTGIPKLNEAMGGGIYTGKSYGFAARKKVGKTALAATISHNLNLSGHKHLFICGEMSAKEIQQRVLARHADVYPSIFRNENSNTALLARLARKSIDLPKNALYADAPGITFDDLKNMVTYAVESYKITGFILDYWQLVGGKSKSQSTSEHLDEVAQWIADYSRKLGIWSITFAQINQEGNTRGGEGIRLAFDQLYQLHRDDLTLPDAWLEMMETRYTKWINIGEKHKAGLLMNEKGPYYEQA